MIEIGSINDTSHFFSKAKDVANRRLIDFIGTHPDDVHNRHRYAFLFSLFISSLIIVVGYKSIFLDKISDPNNYLILSNLLTTLTWFGGIYVGSSALTSLPIFQSSFTSSITEAHAKSIVDEAAAEVTNTVKAAVDTHAKSVVTEHAQTAVEDILAKPLANSDGSSLGSLLSTVAFQDSVTASEIRLAKTHKEDVSSAAAAHKIEPALICAVISRESRWGMLLNPRGPGGVGDPSPRKGVKAPGGGWGRGLMQIDYASWDFAKTGNWENPKANIDFGTNLLEQLLMYFKQKSYDGVDPLQAALASYNCGIHNVESAIHSKDDIDIFTAGGNYSSDVIQRKQFFDSVFDSDFINAQSEQKSEVTEGV